MTKVSTQPNPTNMQIVAGYAKKGTCVLGTIAGSMIYKGDLFSGLDATVGFNVSPWIGGAVTVVSGGLFYTTLGQQPKAFEEEKSTDLLDLENLFEEKTIEKNQQLATETEKDNSKKNKIKLDLETVFEKESFSNQKSATKTKKEEGTDLLSENQLFDQQVFKNLEVKKDQLVQENSANIELELEDLSHKNLKIAKEYSECVNGLQTKLLNSEKPWLDESVLSAADTLFNLANEVSGKLPDYLLDFVKLLETNRIDRTFTEVLTLDDSELYPTAYYLPFVYHMIRSAVCRKSDMGGLRFPGRIAQDVSSSFYEEGTSQHEWRETYNSYCETMRQYLDQDSDLYKLLEPDVSEENYTKMDRTLYPTKVAKLFNDAFKFKS